MRFFWQRKEPVLTEQQIADRELIEMLMRFAVLYGNGMTVTTRAEDGYDYTINIIPNRVKVFAKKIEEEFGDTVFLAIQNTIVINRPGWWQTMMRTKTNECFKPFDTIPETPGTT